MSSWPRPTARRTRRCAAGPRPAPSVTPTARGSANGCRGPLSPIGPRRPTGATRWSRYANPTSGGSTGSSPSGWHGWWSPPTGSCGGGHDHGGGLRPPAGDGDHAGHLRRRPRRELRLLRHTRAGPGPRPQRLRRGPPGGLGVGPAPPGDERVGGRPAERLDARRAARRLPCPASPPTAPTCAYLADAAAAGPLVPAARRRPAAGHRAEDSLRKEMRRAAKRARNRTSDRALPRFTTEHQGSRRIVEEPPLITRVTGADADRIAGALDDYLATLAPHWRRVLGGYTVVDIAHKVVGVGSVGLRAYVALWRAAAPTTWCSCSSSRPAGRCWPRTCTATRPGTPTRASGWWSTSRRSRRSATPCWAGPASTAASTTCASSAT